MLSVFPVTLLSTVSIAAYTPPDVTSFVELVVGVLSGVSHEGSPDPLERSI
jgi:hypothetical protein